MKSQYNFIVILPPSFFLSPSLSPMQSLLPLLKYVRGEVLSPDHWHELFRMLGMPRGTTLEKLTFGDIIKVSDSIIGTCFFFVVVLV